MDQNKSKNTAIRRSREDTRAAILAATREELSKNGWRKFRVDVVSRKARASKQTIYRWWPATGNMCVEAALALVPIRAEQIGPGCNPAERIASLVLPLERATQARIGHAVIRAAIIAGCDDNQAGDVWKNWVNKTIRLPLRQILAELATRHIIRHDFELDQAVDILMGSVWNRILVMRTPMPHGFSQIQAALLLKQLAP